MSAFLKVSGMEFAYGEVTVLRGLDLEVEKGTISCVMGRNGVGKTTFLRNVVGLEKSSAGKVLMEGSDITHMEAYERAERGIGYVPQGRQIFPLLSVEENLAVGLEAVTTGARMIPDDIFTTFPVLDQMRKRKGGDLSGGQQQQLAIARALVTQPKLLVLDEPTEGIQPNVITQIGEIIRSLVEEKGMTILLVEQYVDFVRKFAHSFQVMNRGRFVAKGNTSELDESMVKKHLSV